MKRLVFAVSVGLYALTSPASVSGQDSERTPANWPMIGGTSGYSHYSNLKQINRSNVARLEVAWKFDTGEEGGLETTPLIIDGVVYGITPRQEIIALDAAALARLVQELVEQRRHEARPQRGRVLSPRERTVGHRRRRHGRPRLR